MSKQLNVAPTANNSPEAFVLPVVFEYTVYKVHTGGLLRKISVACNGGRRSDMI